MLELNQPNVEENHVKDVNEETFMDDVIEASKILTYCCRFLGAMVWSL
jgi:hypothetical protein